MGEKEIILSTVTGLFGRFRGCQKGREKEVTTLKFYLFFQPD